MGDFGLHHGLNALRRALTATLCDPFAGTTNASDFASSFALLPVPAFAGANAIRPGPGMLSSEAVRDHGDLLSSHAANPPSAFGDSDRAASSHADESEAQRMIALVELARQGDKEAFGQLYDHYHQSVFRFLYYRVNSTTLAEDLTSETFFRALRSMGNFRWQGKDFGAWLMTIARNLATDHFKAGRTRLEQTTEDLSTLDSATDGLEDVVLASLTNEALLSAMQQLPEEQRECLVLRFLEAKSIAETAEALGRSVGAVKQLQLRAVRKLAQLLPKEAVQ